MITPASTLFASLPPEALETPGTPETAHVLQDFLQVLTRIQATPALLQDTEAATTPVLARVLQRLAGTAAPHSPEATLPLPEHKDQERQILEAVVQALESLLIVPAPSQPPALPIQVANREVATDVVSDAVQGPSRRPSPGVSSPLRAPTIPTAVPGAAPAVVDVPEATPASPALLPAQGRAAQVDTTHPTTHPTPAPVQSLPELPATEATPASPAPLPVQERVAQVDATRSTPAPARPLPEPSATGVVTEQHAVRTVLHRSQPAEALPAPATPPFPATSPAIGRDFSGTPVSSGDVSRATGQPLRVVETATVPPPRDVLPAASPLTVEALDHLEVATLPTRQALPFSAIPAVNASPSTPPVPVSEQTPRPPVSHVAPWSTSSQVSTETVQRLAGTLPGIPEPPQQLPESHPVSVTVSPYEGTPRVASSLPASTPYQTVPIRPTATGVPPAEPQTSFSAVTEAYRQQASVTNGLPAESGAAPSLQPLQPSHGAAGSAARQETAVSLPGVPAADPDAATSLERPGASRPGAFPGGDVAPYRGTSTTPRETSQATVQQAALASPAPRTVHSGRDIAATSQPLPASTPTTSAGNLPSFTPSSEAFVSVTSHQPQQTLPPPVPTHNPGLPGTAGRPVAVQPEIAQALPAPSPSTPEDAVALAPAPATSLASRAPRAPLAAPEATPGAATTRSSLLSPSAPSQTIEQEAPALPATPPVSSSASARYAAAGQEASRATNPERLPRLSVHPDALTTPSSRSASTVTVSSGTEPAPQHQAAPVPLPQAPEDRHTPATYTAANAAQEAETASQRSPEPLRAPLAPGSNGPSASQSGIEPTKVTPFSATVPHGEGTPSRQPPQGTAPLRTPRVVPPLQASGSDALAAREPGRTPAPVRAPVVRPLSPSLQASTGVAAPSLPVEPSPTVVPVLPTTPGASNLPSIATPQAPTPRQSVATVDTALRAGGSGETTPAVAPQHPRIATVAPPQESIPGGPASANQQADSAAHDAGNVIQDRVSELASRPASAAQPLPPHQRSTTLPFSSAPGVVTTRPAAAPIQGDAAGVRQTSVTTVPPGPPESAASQLLASPLQRSSGATRPAAPAPFVSTEQALQLANPLEAAFSQRQAPAAVDAWRFAGAPERPSLPDLAPAGIHPTEIAASDAVPLPGSLLPEKPLQALPGISPGRLAPEAIVPPTVDRSTPVPPDTAVPTPPSFPGALEHHNAARAQHFSAPGVLPDATAAVGLQTSGYIAPPVSDRRTTATGRSGSLAPRHEAAASTPPVGASQSIESSGPPAALPFVVPPPAPGRLGVDNPVLPPEPAAAAETAPAIAGVWTTTPQRLPHPIALQAEPPFLPGERGVIPPQDDPSQVLAAEDTSHVVLQGQESFSTPTPEPETAPPPPLPFNLENLSRLWERPGTPRSVVLQLEPRELGTVVVQVHLTDKGVVAAFRTETAAARTLLHGHLPALQDALQQQGVSTQHLSVSLSSEGWYEPFAAPLPPEPSFASFGQGRQGEGYRRKKDQPETPQTLSSGEMFSQMVNMLI